MKNTHKNIYILGVGHNTIESIDLAEACGFKIAGLYHFESGREGELYFGHKIIGNTNDLLSENLTGRQFLLSMGDNKIRGGLFEKIRGNGGVIPTIIHPSAIVSGYARLGDGVCINANSVVSPDTFIDDDSVISSNDLVTHSTRIGKHCFIAGNVVLGAYTVMRDYSFIGLGATIISGKVKEIGEHALIGAGAVVTKTVMPHARVAGNPARSI